MPFLAPLLFLKIKNGEATLYILRSKIYLFNYRFHIEGVFCLSFRLRFLRALAKVNSLSFCGFLFLVYFVMDLLIQFQLSNGFLSQKHLNI
jgi:hypothetical protein